MPLLNTEDNTPGSFAAQVTHCAKEMLYPGPGDMGKPSIVSHISLRTHACKSRRHAPLYPATGPENPCGIDSPFAQAYVTIWPNAATSAIASGCICRH